MTIKKPFYKRNWFLWVCLIFLTPVGLILLWTTHKDKPKKSKFILTIMFIIWFAPFIILGIEELQFKLITLDSNTATSSSTLSSNTSNISNYNKEEDSSTTIKPTVDSKTLEKNKISNYIENNVKENYIKTNIDKITINEHLGTDTEDDYIALVYLTWDMKNSGKKSKEMLNMFSQDLAAKLGKNYPNVQEVAIFWTVPYLSNSSNIAKCSYERKGEGMYEMDIIWGSEFY